MTDTARWRAVVSRDPASHNTFVYCVKTTRIYCRPTCKARLARRANVEFRDSPEDAEADGYRACKRCKPQMGCKDEAETVGITRVCRMLDGLDGGGLTEEGKLPGLEVMARVAGLSKCHFHRRFKGLTGVTPREYALEVKRRGGSERSASNGRSIGTSTVGQSPASFETEPTRCQSEEEFKLGNLEVSMPAEKLPCYWATIETTYGLLLVTFQHHRVCKMQLCTDHLEACVTLEQEFPPEMYTYRCLDLEIEQDLYQQQIKTIVEALENPSGKVLEIEASMIC